MLTFGKKQGEKTSAGRSRVLNGSVQTTKRGHLPAKQDQKASQKYYRQML